MILIVLGSQKFQFNRLLKAVDDQVAEGKIKDNIFAQTGVSDYKPKHYPHQAFLDRAVFDQLLEKADTVITHGGSGAMIGASKKGKKVIAVARRAKYGEHVDDHQLQLIEQLRKLDIICECQTCDDIWKAIEAVKKKKYKSYQSHTNEMIESIEKFISTI